MIIELHLLQSFPASNLNRDDVGQPKSVTFGGVTRGRVSSQCLKRSARLKLPEEGLEPSETADRTKRLVGKAAAVLDGGEPSEGTVDVVREGVRRLGFGVADKDLTEYLMFVGKGAARTLAEYCEENRASLEAAAEKRKEEAKKEAEKKSGRAKKPEKTKPTGKDVKWAQKLLDSGKAVDIALFGRMIADNKDFNVDAASQVAHAMSTHPVAVEFDYYTAVDDLKPDAEAGADMIGTVDFNAACYYRYANLDLDQFKRNLGKNGDDEDLVRRAVRAWLRSFAKAVPSGKQNSMAAHTLPDTLLGVVRDSGAWNLANAFLKPVTADHEKGTDLMAESTHRMMEHFNRLRGFYGEEEVRSVVAASMSGNLRADDVREGEQAGSFGAFVDGVVRGAGV